jgi:serine protease Do
MLNRYHCRLNRGGGIAVLAVAWLAAAAPAFAQATTPPPAAPAPIKIAIGGTYLGVGVVDIVSAERARELNLKEPRGVEITWVGEDTPAERAGIVKGDVVLDYNGVRVEGQEQFVRLVRETPAGRTVKITVSRAGATHNLTATIETRKGKVISRDMFPNLEPNVNVWIPDIPRAFTSWRSSMLGIEAETLDGQLAQYFGVKEGVLVRSVGKDSAAEKAGLKAGDVIVKVDGTEISSPRELSSQMRAQRNRQTLPLTLMRERRETTVTVTLDSDGSGPERPARRTTVRQEEF